MTWTYEPLQEVAACNFCGSPRSEWLWLADRDRAGHQATSVLCRNCGLVFITPRMTAEGYAEFYGSGAYRQIAGQFGHDKEKMQDSQGKYARAVGNWLTGVLPHSIEGGTLLDIGGSNGIVAAELKQRFGLSQATVLEPSQSECGEAADRGLCGEPGSLESWEPGQRSYNFITLWQTVDHLLDIACSFAKIRRILAPGGLFALDIVNFPFLLKAFRKVERAVKIDHPYGLSPSVMACFLLRAGFEIVTHASMLGGRKVFFLCRHGEPKNVLPDKSSVDFLLRLLEEVRRARVGV